MRRSILAGASALGLTAVMALGAAVPAQALSISVSGKTCGVDATRTSSSATATNVTCSQVMASITYYQGAAGVPYTAYGPKSKTKSTATSPSLTVVSRSVTGWVGNTVGTVSF